MDKISETEIQNLDKKQLRKRAKEVRNAIDSESKILRDLKLKDMLLNSVSYNKAEYVFIYVSFGSEIDTIGIIKECVQDGKKVCIPVIYGDEMFFMPFKGFEYLEENSYGILEPEYVSDEEVIINSDSVLVCPGLIFDDEGYRLGYGGGYYDRYITKHEDKGFKSVGLCYEELFVDTLNPKSFDKKVDKVIVG